MKGDKAHVSERDADFLGGLPVFRVLTNAGPCGYGLVVITTH